MNLPEKPDNVVIVRVFAETPSIAAARLSSCRWLSEHPAAQFDTVLFDATPKKMFTIEEESDIPAAYVLIGR